MSRRRITLELRELSLQEAKRAAIVEAMRRCEGHPESAAELLGIGSSTMYRLVKELGIEDEERFGTRK